SALGLAGLFALAALFAFVRARQHDQAVMLKHLAGYGAIFIASVALIAGWWFVRNQMLYADWLGWNAFLDVVGRRVPPASLVQLWSEREGFVWAYWGVFGTLNVVMPHFVYDLLGVMALVALLGGASAVLRRVNRSP